MFLELVNMMKAIGVSYVGESGGISGGYVGRSVNIVEEVWNMVEDNTIFTRILSFYTWHLQNL